MQEARVQQTHQAATWYIRRFGSIDERVSCARTNSFRLKFFDRVDTSIVSTNKAGAARVSDPVSHLNLDTKYGAGTARQNIPPRLFTGKRKTLQA